MPELRRSGGKGKIKCFGGEVKCSLILVCTPSNACPSESSGSFFSSFSSGFPEILKERLKASSKDFHPLCVKREKKQIIPTEDGLKLITVLPDVVKSPKLTADWENALTLVAKGELPMEDFMADISR